MRGFDSEPDLSCNTNFDEVIGNGGGIFSQNGTTITSCQFLSNIATLGGAIYTMKIGAIVHTTISNNTAMYGGAVFLANDYVTMNVSEDSAIYDNQALFQANYTSPIAALHIDNQQIVTYSGAYFSSSLWFTDMFQQVIANASVVVKTNAFHLPFVLSNLPEGTSTVDCEGSYEFTTLKVVSIAPDQMFNITYEAYSTIELKDSYNWFINQSVYVAPCPPYLLSITDDSSGIIQLCGSCSSGTYTTDSTTCIPCPNERGDCLTFPDGNHITITSSFPSVWTNPTYLSTCLNENACKPSYDCSLSYQVDNKEWQIECDSCEQTPNSDCHCKLGYSERLCSKCIFTEDVCYYNNGDFSCVNYEDLKGGLWLPFFEAISFYTVSVIVFAFPKTAASSAELKTLTLFVQVTTVLNEKIIFNGFIQILSSLSSSDSQPIFNSHAALRCTSYTLFSNETVLFIYNTIVSTLLKIVGVLFLVFVKVVLVHVYRCCFGDNPTEADPSIDDIFDDRDYQDDTDDIELSSLVHGERYAPEQYQSKSFVKEYMMDVLHVILYLFYSVYFSLLLEHLFYSSFYCISSTRNQKIANFIIALGKFFLFYFAIENFLIGGFFKIFLRNLSQEISLVWHGYYAVSITIGSCCYLSARNRNGVDSVGACARHHNAVFQQSLQQLPRECE